ncbi:MAG: hypothetical protein MUE58_12585 [Chitinophagaceae bacterium]|nr:hypothetical protein [Chitinophagaceae bacterium]
MVTDSLFHTEQRRFRKISLLFTVPCAILPVIMASAGLMSIPFEPMFFRYDWLLWLAVYGVYMAGMDFSWLHHRKLVPALLFVAHLVSLGLYLFAGQIDVFGYTTILSIIITSVSNQFFRVGSFECEVCSIDSEACMTSSDAHPLETSV